MARGEWAPQGRGRGGAAAGISTPQPRRHRIAVWFERYIPEEDRPAVHEAIQKAIRPRSVFKLEHRVKRVDGTVGRTFSRAVPLLEDGEIVEWIGAAIEVEGDGGGAR